jgi:hypothetical protein
VRVAVGDPNSTWFEARGSATEQPTRSVALTTAIPRTAIRIDPAIARLLLNERGTPWLMAR